MDRRKISLAAARVNAGLQQKEVAKRIGIVPITLLNWEKGRTIPSIEHARQLAEIYAIPLDEIFFTQEH